MLYFITGNSKKFEEASAMVPDLKQLDVDLPELQQTDARKIVAAKLEEAWKHAEGEFVIEDTSLYLECLNGLPGPLIKWFLETIGNDGLSLLCERLGNDRAEARTIVGYAKDRGQVRFFEGAVKGKIVWKKPGSGFGWDPIFLPDGQSKTFSEMSKDEKNAISMRRIAFGALAEFLRHGK